MGDLFTNANPARIIETKFDTQDLLLLLLQVYTLSQTYHKLVNQYQQYTGWRKKVAVGVNHHIVATFGGFS